MTTPGPSPFPAVRRWWSACTEAIDALAFPSTCLVCGEDGLLSPFCDPCRAELIEAGGLACERCAMPVGPWGDRSGGCSECRGRRLGFDATLALGPYEGPIRHLCLKLKREPNAWLARWAAELLVEAHGPGLLAIGASRVVPVPLHWRRRLVRGYNQAEALARPLAGRLGLPVSQPLRRIQPTPPLARLGRTARTSLMRGAFRSRKGLALDGETILLVDDILTTGATCGEAARALKRAGAGRVVVVVVGRAEGNA